MVDRLAVAVALLSTATVLPLFFADLSTLAHAPTFPVLPSDETAAPPNQATVLPMTSPAKKLPQRMVDGSRDIELVEEMRPVEYAEHVI
jgi:hypothetical protein